MEEKIETTKYYVDKHNISLVTLKELSRAHWRRGKDLMFIFLSKQLIKNSIRY